MFKPLFEGGLEAYPLDAKRAGFEKRDNSLIFGNRGSRKAN
jgi:hypothetical protein